MLITKECYIYTKDSTMKKIILICVGFILFLWVTMFLASCEAPYQITETVTKDSTGNEVRFITKTYNNSTTVVPQASVNVVTNPFWYGYGQYWAMPYYNYSPHIVVPINPSIHYNQAPHYTPRGGRH